MSLITAIDGSQIGPFAAAKATLGADDTFVYNKTKKQVAIFDNTTGGSLTVNIKGDGVTTTQADGIGSIDLSAGKSVVVAAGAQVAVVLNTIAKYLSGNFVHLTGAATLKVVIVNL